MKKIIKWVSSLALLSPAIALAEDIPVPKPGRTPGGDLVSLITTISNTILLLVGVVAVLFLILGGFQYISSAGNPETIGKAKHTILYAVIGILVTLVAWAGVNFIIGQFSG